MKNKVLLQIVIMTIVVMCIQIFIPAFNFYNLVIVPDILIIFLTYIGFYHGRFYVIILGFFIGISQDFITQVELMGAMAFTKSAIGFGLGTLALYRNIWSGNIMMLFIFLRLTIRLLERPQTNKRPEYEEYVKSTNIFFPGWKKN